MTLLTSFSASFFFAMHLKRMAWLGPLDDAAPPRALASAAAATTSSRLPRSGGLMTSACGSTPAQSAIEQFIAQVAEVDMMSSVSLIANSRL